MASPASFTQRRQKIRRRTLQGFTLVELLISAGLSGIILVGVLTAFLMIGRVSTNIQNYSEIEASARKALETISRDVHSAYAIKTFSATSVDLAIPDATANAPTSTTADLVNYPDGYLPDHYVEYTYNSIAGTITRTVRDSSHNNPVTTTLLSNVQTVPGLASPYNNIFHYYCYIPTSATSVPGVGYVNGPPIAIGATGNNEITTYTSSNGVQQVEVKFYIIRQSTTVTSATNKVLSARFILRNKSSTT